MKFHRRVPPLNWPVFGVNGVELGTVLSVQCDPADARPEWLLIRLCGLRRRLRLVPAANATWQSPGRLTVPYREDQVIASPQATDTSITEPEWRQRVLHFYGNQTSAAA